jgi:hypothetical protein
MPNICSFYGITIWIYWNDHNPPHFHAKYAENEILIIIETLATYSGSLPSRALALVLEWALLHQEELMDDWSLAQNDLKLKKIEPLK